MTKLAKIAINILLNAALVGGVFIVGSYAAAWYTGKVVVYTLRIGD